MRGIQVVVPYSEGWLLTTLTYKSKPKTSSLTRSCYVTHIYPV